MGNKLFIDICIRMVVEYFNKHRVDGRKLYKEDVYVVWSCKTLQNHKALLSTTVPDGMYYELTYNGDKDELYLDAYKKWENVCTGNVSKKFARTMKSGGTE